MKRVPPAVLLALALACLLPAAGQAAEKVGRTSFELPPGWELVTQYEGRLTFDGGARWMAMYHALYQLPGSADTPRALLLVSSTGGGHDRNVDWVSEKCPEPRAGYHTDDFGGRMLKRKRECLVVNPAFAPARFFNEDSGAIKGLQAKGLQLFRSGYSLRSVVGARGGTLLRVNLMTQPGFPGLDGAAPRATDLHGVPPALVAWGEALHDAVDSSVYSAGGELRLPALTFTR
jgi:hypothetical protein